MTSRHVFGNYFDLLEETLDEFDLKDKPSQIYNCDESGMPLEHKPIILGCCSATGQAIPPMVVFSGKTFNYEVS